MNVEDMQVAQHALDMRIKARAVELGYDPAKVEPVYDGVVDWEGYLAAPVKVCWILKEPYDDTDANGNPGGGGWTMFKDTAPGKTLAQSVNANRALRNVAYASWGLIAGARRYADIPRISNAPEVADSLRSVCYLNTGKMPAATSTPHEHLRQIHREWRDIVLEQIRLADPDVLIFCTLNLWLEDFDVDIIFPPASVVRGTGSSKAVTDIHVWRGKRILWANHPASRVPRANWVDSILEAARKPLP